MTSRPLLIGDEKPPDSVFRTIGTAREETVDGEGRHVLVVEDNISVGQFATQLLDDLGYAP